MRTSNILKSIGARWKNTLLLGTFQAGVITAIYGAPSPRSNKANDDHIKDYDSREKDHFSCLQISPKAKI